MPPLGEPLRLAETVGGPGGRRRPGQARPDTADLLDGRKGASTAPGLKRLLFSMEGFDAELSAAARRRPDVELIDPARLYEGS